jgi:hypothetical protein
MLTFHVILIETSTSGEITSTSTEVTTTAITTTSSPGTNLQCLINHVKKK